MHALFIAKAANDPSTRYRVNPIAEALRKSGWEVSILCSSGLINRLNILQSARTTDIVVIQRKLFGRIFLTILVYFSRKIIFDFDDAIFVHSDGSASVGRYRRFTHLLQSCSMVWAGNGYLAEQARQFCKNTHIIPTSIDPDKYGVIDEKERKFTLVWIGSSSTSKYLKASTQLLNRIGQSFPEVRLRIIADFEFNLDDLETQAITWTEDTEAKLLAESHVGIAPMLDDAWSRGKCALKVLQYMAAGLPVISSPVGANLDAIDESTTGFFADTEERWIEALKILIEDENLRCVMGSAARSRIIDKYATNIVLDNQINSLRTLQDTTM